MPIKTSRPATDSAIRSYIFDTIGIANIEGFQKVNDRTFGTIVTDTNGEQRYVRIGVIVAQPREDISAVEQMNAEIADYNAKQADKAEKAAQRKAKADADKAAREAAKKAKEAGE